MSPRHIRRTLLAALLAVMVPAAGTLVPATEARASALAELTDEQLTDASTWIVRGEVTDTWTELDADSGVVWTRTRVLVSEVYKGPGEPPELVVDTLGGEHDGVELVVWQVPRWSEGEDVLLFLDQLESGRLSTLGFYLGKYTIRRAPGETRHHVLRWMGGPDEPYDHRFLPHPPAYKRVYLDEVLQRVEDRLEAGWDGRPIPGLSDAKLRRINTPELRRRR